MQSDIIYLFGTRHIFTEKLSKILVSIISTIGGIAVYVYLIYRNSVMSMVRQIRYNMHFSVSKYLLLLQLFMIFLQKTADLFGRRKSNIARYRLRENPFKGDNEIRWIWGLLQPCYLYADNEKSSKIPNTYNVGILYCFWFC